MDHLLYTLTPLQFKTPSWDDIYASIAFTNETENKKKQWVNCVAFLQEQFGFNFFKNCGQNHPILLKLTVNIFLMDELIDFVGCLQKLKASNPRNYDVLLKKLKPRILCQQEGIPFTDVLRFFSPHGFAMNIVEEQKHARTPDLELVDETTGEIIYVEISQLRQSESRQFSSNQFRTLSNAFLKGYDLPKACQQLQAMTEDKMKEVLETIRGMKERAASEMNLQSYEDEFIRMAVCHPAKISELDQWCAARQMDRNQMGGLPVDFNETPRLVKNSKIINKIKQLPPGRPGLIYIPVPFLYFFQMDFADTAISITEQLLDYPQCIGVCLYAPISGSLLKTGLTEVEGSRLSITKVNGLIRHVFFISNPGFTVAVSAVTLAKFHRALR